MSDPALERALADSVAQVLDRMFFIQAPAEPRGAPFQPSDGFTARLHFDGERSGCLTLQVSRAAARSIAADFLGAEEPMLKEEQVEEVVCELANMICGSFLSRVESDGALRLATPRIVAGQAVGLPPGATTHAVETGHGSLMVTVNTGRPECPLPPEYGS